MEKLSTWSKINVGLASIMVVVGYLVPILVERLEYGGKVREVESVCSNIAQKELETYATSKQYIEVNRRNQSTLLNRLQVRNVDLKYYTYMVVAMESGFKIQAEPKIAYLKSREVPPKIYTYIHNGKDEIKRWESF